MWAHETAVLGSGVDAVYAAILQLSPPDQIRLAADLLERDRAELAHTILERIAAELGAALCVRKAGGMSLCTACGTRPGSDEDPLYAGLCVSCAWRVWYASVKPTDGSEWCDACRDYHMPGEHAAETAGEER